MSELYIDPSRVFFSIVSLMMFCVRYLRWWYYCQLIKWQSMWIVATNSDRLWVAIRTCKSKLFSKYFYLWSPTFWFWSVKIWYLKISVQAQTLKAAMQNYFKKSCLKDFKFLIEDLWSFTTNVLWNQTFSSLFIAIDWFTQSEI